MESSTEFAQKVKARARIGSDNPAAGHTEIKLACQRDVCILIFIAIFLTAVESV